MEAQDEPAEFSLNQEEFIADLISWSEEQKYSNKGPMVIVQMINENNSLAEESIAKVILNQYIEASILSGKIDLGFFGSDAFWNSLSKDTKNLISSFTGDLLTKIEFKEEFLVRGETLYLIDSKGNTIFNYSLLDEIKKVIKAALPENTSSRIVESLE